MVAASTPLKPIDRLLAMLWEDRRDLMVLVVYTLFTGLLFLAVPLAAQALVNIIAAGVMVQPLIVLTLAVLGGLVFVGVLRILQLYLVEAIQQRIFARVALRLSEHILRIRRASLKNRYAPELINRFFDTLTIQKTLAQILLDGPAALLQMGIGLLLLAIYSPWLMLFDLVLIGAVLLIGLLGRGAVGYSLAESSCKYEVAQWLEELSRCEVSFKMNGLPPYLVQRTDRQVKDYILARRKHFGVIVRQAFSNYMLEAIALASIFAIGGWLVINRQLTLGQLVAAELIIVTVLSALDKLVLKLESFYDLLTGFEKVGNISDLPLERSGGRLLSSQAQGASVVCDALYFEYEISRPIFRGLNLIVSAGSRISLVGPSGVGKSTLAALLCGLYEPSYGSVSINGLDVRDLDLNHLRRHLALVGGSHELFDGTVEENITLGRENISHADLQWAIDITEMPRDLRLYRDGLSHRVVSEGRNLSMGQRHRILMARAIVEKPQLLILDEAFTGMDEMTKLKVVEQLFAHDNHWTIINISHDAEVVSRTQMVHLLESGNIRESGDPRELARQSDSEFSKLFPELAQLVSGKMK